MAHTKPSASWCKMKNRLLMILLCIILPLSCAGCSSRLKRDMPDAVSAQDCFDCNQDRIALVTDYLLSLKHPDVWINDANGTYFSDFEWHSIEDRTVRETIEALWESGISDIRKNTKANSISFEIWRSFQEVDCGVAFSVDGIHAPSVEFMTQVEPLTERGWYYYVADYNQWRIEHPTTN